MSARRDCRLGKIVETSDAASQKPAVFAASASGM